MAKKKAKAKAKRKPNPAFMKPMTPSAALAAVVGSKPIPRTEITKKIWDYIKKNKLQDAKNRRNINSGRDDRVLSRQTCQIQVADRNRISRRTSQNQCGKSFEKRAQAAGNRTKIKMAGLSARLNSDSINGLEHKNISFSQYTSRLPAERII